MHQPPNVHHKPPLEGAQAFRAGTAATPMARCALFQAVGQFRGTREILGKPPQPLDDLLPPCDGVLRGGGFGPPWRTLFEKALITDNCDDHP
jgi:hypothetical protein